MKKKKILDKVRRLVTKNAGYICSMCARKYGGRWPKGHCATVHEGPCDICGKVRSLSCVNDWLWGKDKQLKEWD